jgi:hypothetical protein
VDIERDGNVIEAGVWLLVALLLGWQARREHGAARGVLLVLGAVVLAFGGSDLVEARTGAWWRPWWLLVWKAACVVLMLGLFGKYFRLRKRRGDGE